MQNDTCYILALIKRDDGERLLLGSGFYEFTKEQKHFNPNVFANDIVELQGADGQLLAGQVRRSSAQSFDGYIGDGTTSKQMVEQKRREFFLFFRKQHHYTVVYIMPDGTAIKRDRGYIVDAPAVQELYQVQPKWHIALAFEDVNYYSYAEDAQGNEIYSFTQTLGLANVVDGGLIWDNNGAVSDPQMQIFTGLKGDTYQNGTPTPSSPVPIQTVTGEQTITVNGTDYPVNLGKNLNDNTGWEQGQYASGVWGSWNTKRATSSFIPVTGGTYTMSLNATGNLTSFLNLNYFDGNKTWLGNRETLGMSAFTLTDRVKTFTLPSTACYLRVTVRPYGGDDQGDNTIQYAPSEKLQVEVGSTNTSFVDYIAPIELHKLGTYQDRIYPDGDDWKIEKQFLQRTFNGDDTDIVAAGWFNSSETTSTTQVCGLNIATLGASFAGREDSKMTHFILQNVGAVQDGIFRLINNIAGATNHVRVALSKTIAADLTAGKAWIAAHLPKLVTPLLNPTTTTITDATLIAQLNAVKAAIDEHGSASISATSPNLPAILGLTPNMDTGGYVWAPSTGGGPVTVTVDGVDSANPVWHVFGACSNPTLTNGTTGQALTWNGDVPAGQELIIDMGAQTATLEGANVFEFVSGSWVQLAPGSNRISYTAANTTQDSKIEWNEIVG